jgi:hypothetical protein
MASDNRFGIFKLENLIIFVIFYENKYTKQHPNCDDFVPEKLKLCQHVDMSLSFLLFR